MRVSLLILSTCVFGWMSICVANESVSPPGSMEVVPSLEENEPDKISVIKSDERPLVPEPFLNDYFGAKPKRFLIDPQNLISRNDRKKLEDFLIYHAGDSSIDIYVSVFATDQRIPDEVLQDELIKRHFSEGKPAVICHYFLDAPRRSTIHLSASLTDVVSVTEQGRALDSSKVGAMKTRSSSQQLEEFLVQMSIRVYWMERMLEGSINQELENLPSNEVDQPFENDELATENDHPVWLVNSVWAAGGLGLSAIILWGLVTWLKIRRKFMFPELPVEPRLGGVHAAGIGAVVSFSSPALAPASQRDQIPAHTRRA